MTKSSDHLVFFIVFVVVYHVSLATTDKILECQRIDAAVRWSSNNRTYFFSGSEYILYNDNLDAEEDVFPVSEIAQRFPHNLDAAATWFGQNRSVYFKKCMYYQLTEHVRRLRRKKLSEMGLPCNVDAAVRRKRELLVFKGCRYWSLKKKNSKAKVAGWTSDLGLPCDVDAASTWSNGTIFVIKNDVIWTLSASADQRGHVQTHSLDDLSICSWRICQGSDNQTQDNNIYMLANYSYTENGMTSAENYPCNGDARFCSLKLDQFTLPGSHNAGAGFDSGFGLFNCWVRNQHLSILEQLRMGIRFLDVDPSWEHCGLLGTYHSFLCGGPICRMLKQVKKFLLEDRTAVLVINFNHEMKNGEKVIPALVRQIRSEVGHYVSSHHRETGHWPTLEHVVRSNKRLFIIIDSRVKGHVSYGQNNWIHSEELVRSTWRADVTVKGDCQSVLQVAKDQCLYKSNAPLLEVSILGTSTGCVTTVARLCLPLVHQIARACAEPRRRWKKAPNALLVDFPDLAQSAAESVVSAAYLQNVRNLLSFSGETCRAHVDATVTWFGSKEADGMDRVYFFSRARVIVYNWALKIQESARSLRELGLPDRIDAAFRPNVSNQMCVINGCHVICFKETNRQDKVLLNLTSEGLPCNIDAALSKDNDTLFFKGCQYWVRKSEKEHSGPYEISDFGLPCNITAAFRAPDGTDFYFKGNNYWKLISNTTTGLLDSKDITDWNMDLVHCDTL